MCREDGITRYVLLRMPILNSRRKRRSLKSGKLYDDQGEDFGPAALRNTISKAQIGRWRKLYSVELNDPVDEATLLVLGNLWKTILVGQLTIALAPPFGNC
eukprot:s2178_g4.t1